MIITNFHRLAILFSLTVGNAALSGCGVSTDYMLVTTDVYPRQASIYVAILNEPPDFPFLRLATIEATAGIFSTREDLRNAVIHQAKELGADAVIDLSHGSRMKGDLVGSRTSVTDSSRKHKSLSATAIRYQ